MPYQILSKTKLSEGVFSLWVEAPRLAQKRRAGQFIILRPRENSERVPLTMVASDERAIRLIFQAVGYTTMELASLVEGESVHDLTGPLGQPTELLKDANVICVGGGIGVAPVLPIATALKANGCRVTGVIGARKKELLILEEEMKSACAELLIATDDGSYGHHGFVTDLLRQKLEEGKISHAYIVGPLPMMAACAKVLEEFKVPGTVSLNSLMIDGTGMCGGCRVTVGGKTKYTCVDGPEFPADAVNFDELRGRLGAYREFEHVCRLRAKEEGLA